MSKIEQNFTIKYWAEADRPREKLLTQGRQMLTDAELIAILIGSGSRTESAVELAKRILKAVNNNLSELAKLSINDLIKFKGIGDAKAISIVAALELGRRRRDTEPTKQNKIQSSVDIFTVFQQHFIDIQHEEFWILLLNQGNIIISKKNISKGGFVETAIDIRIIFKHALENAASAIVLCHNHPSGNCKPSNLDIILTKKIQAAGNMLDIKVLDHLIISEQGYFSFADEELINHTFQ